VRRDGWGPDAGDRGSAWEIGRAGIAAVFSALDRVGPPTVLSGAFAEQLGAPPGLEPATRLLSTPNRVAEVAAFARRVLNAAEGGDGVADGIVASAVSGIVSSARSAAEETGARAVTLRGGLTRHAGWVGRVVRMLSEAGLRGEVSRRPMGELDPATLLAEPYRSACALIRPAP
jgi:N-acetylglucosamine kinase-like BadF-type ATPase